MNTNKLEFLLILLFSFSTYTMEKNSNDKPLTVENSNTDEDAIQIVHIIEIPLDQNIRNNLENGDDSSKMEEEIDLPPLDLFLNDRNLLEIRLIIEELKEAKKTRRNIFSSNLLFHGPHGNGKSTLARIISKESGWNLVTLEAKDLVRGYCIFVKDGDVNKESLCRGTSVLSLEQEEAENENLHIKKILNKFLLALSKVPTILFINNIEKVVNDGDASILSLFIHLFENFKPFSLIFMITSTRNLGLISNTLIREIGQPMHIGLPDYKRRRSIMNYYFDKNPVQIEGLDDLLIARNIKSYSSLDMFKKIATATQNFYGSDIEEVIIDAVCALNNHITNTAKVSTLFIAKNEYDFKDSPFYSGIISIIFPLVYAVELGSRLINTDAEEYLLSFCAIKQDEIRLQNKN